MGVRDLLSPPRMNRRARSEGGGEVASTEGTGPQVDTVVPRHAESTPDLGTNPPTSPTPIPPIVQDQGSRSMRTTLFRMFI